MENKQIAVYTKNILKDRLYLLLMGKNTQFSAKNYLRQLSRSVQKYTTAFLNKTELDFRGNIYRFLGNPLQMHLMLECSVGHFKKWIENGGGQTPVFSYVCNYAQLFPNYNDRF